MSWIAGRSWWRGAHSPNHHSSAMSRQILRQNSQPSHLPIPDPQKLWSITAVKRLGLGSICYAAIDNQFIGITEPKCCKKNEGQPRTVYWANLFLKDKGKIKLFQDEQKWREFNIRACSQGILKCVLQEGGNNLRTLSVWAGMPSKQNSNVWMNPSKPCPSHKWCLMYEVKDRSKTLSNA